jgi:hypothetical protein
MARKNSGMLLPRRRFEKELKEKEKLKSELTI